MIVVPYALTAVEQATIVAFAARHRLPAIYGSEVFVGGLMSYAPVEGDLFRGVAQYADSILKGAKPADLPVQAPTRFRLVINATTANALGLTIPPTLLATADEVIE
jgi:putative tryptophan/tyrosine transport system substrate-binding protein